MKSPSKVTKKGNNLVPFSKEKLNKGKVFFFFVLIAALFLFFQEGRIYSGLLGDISSQEERLEAAENFSFDNYYTYTAAISDLRKILSTGDKKEFVDRVLMRQKPYIQISQPHSNKEGRTTYSYEFENLYSIDAGFLCRKSNGDRINVTYDRVERLSSIVLVNGCFGLSLLSSPTQSDKS